MAASFFALRTPPATLSTRNSPITTTTAPVITTVDAPTRSCSERRQVTIARSNARASQATAGRRKLRRHHGATTRTRSLTGVLITAGRTSRRPGLVTHPAHRQHHLGLLRVALDLRAQPLDVDVNEPGVGRVPVAPDLLQQHLAGEDLPRLAGERDQQVELERGQRDLLAVALDLVRLHVDRDRRVRRPDLQRLA